MRCATLSLERVELPSRAGQPLQTKLIDHIQRTRRPLALLVLLVRPKDKLHQRVWISCSGAPEVAGFLRKPLKVLFANATGHPG